MQHIRNFSIIAHIDHGKSTLADRFIQRCGGLPEREMSEQVLDSMDLERERGITIKAQTAALQYTARDGKTYNLNLIDTPGHVDFSYEVSRLLAACEGALLVVDASQGVEAQTVANCYTAIEQGVEVVPVLNKIDLPSANPERAIQEIEDVIGIKASDALLVSAKTGEGVEEVLEAVIHRIPPPKGDPAAPLKALIIDSWFDNYVGVIMLVRLVDGSIRPKDKLLLMSTQAVHLCEQVGVFTPKSQGREQLSAGEVGFVRRSQGTPARPRRRHHDPGKSPRGHAAAGFQGNQAAGVRRAVSGRGERVRSAARRAGEVEAQRRIPALRTGNLPGARLRIPLRVSGPAAHGHRAGAPRARIRHGARDHRPHRRLRDSTARRRGYARREPGEDAGSVENRRDPRADHRNG